MSQDDIQPSVDPPVERGTETRRLWAIVPAAGHSRRMGRPKLLLPWGGTTILGKLVEALRSAGVQEIFVVARQDDSALLNHLGELQVTAVVPEIAPPEMRDSVQAGVNFLRQHRAPRDSDGWLLIPADHPLVAPSTVDALWSSWASSGSQDVILIPHSAGRRGHPTLFGWSWAARIAEIPADQGLNWLVRRNPERVLEVPVSDPGAIADLDTPEDYARILGRPLPDGTGTDA